MDTFLKVPNLNMLQSLVNHAEGEIAFVEDTNSCYVYHDDNWLPINVKAEPGTDGLNISLYDLNKQIIGQLDPLSAEELDEKVKMLNCFGKKNLYMLNCKEINYFTILAYNDSENLDYSSFGEGIISLLYDLTDSIYAIDEKTDDVVEIWIKYEEEPIVFYLFNYENGLVTYGR